MTHELAITLGKLAAVFVMTLFACAWAVLLERGDKPDEKGPDERDRIIHGLSDELSRMREINRTLRCRLRSLQGDRVDPDEPDRREP